MEKHLKAVIITACVVLAVLITAVTLIIRSDWRFVITQKIHSVFTSADIEKTDCDYTSYSVDDLKARDDTVFNNSLLLINGKYMISDDIDTGIVEYNGIFMSNEITSAYKSLADEILSSFDTKLFVSSAYRTASEQSDIYEEKDSSVAAKVGASEHQSGLALDVYVRGYSGKALIKCDAGRYINSDCYKYGFIIRYPHGKEDITEITYEPWHIRYVGIPHSEIIYKNSVTLEEYIQSLEIGSFYEYDDYIISRQYITDTLNIPDGYSEITVSPDNTGCYIVTCKR